MKRKRGRPSVSGVRRDIIKRVRLSPSEALRLESMDIDPTELVRAIAQARINTLKKRGLYKTPAPPEYSGPDITNGYIYFILAPTIRRVKIGYTAGSPHKRLAALQTGSADTLSLVGFVRGSMEDELSIHERFRGARVVGEWFTLTQEVREYIDSVCEGGFA